MAKKRNRADNKLADKVLLHAVLVNWPRGKVGAIQKMAEFKSGELKALRSKDFGRVR